MPRSSTSSRLTLALAAGLAALLAAPAFASGLASGLASAPGDGVLREGQGDRRARASAMELKPFPADAWSALTDWTNGSAPTPESLSGKPVLIATWASWTPTADRARAVATRMAEKYGAQGLVVVLAHAPRGWAEATKPAAPAGATLLVAHDAQGKFRDALLVDADPDFYVIDRAGQLRFADISTDAVDGALQTVVGEQADQAGRIRGDLDEARRAAEREARRTAGAGAIDLRRLPEIPFTKPAPEAYENLRWPERPRDPNQPADQPLPEPPSVALLEDGWFPAKPPTDGRVVVLYFWSPDILETYEPWMREMDVLQRRNPRDLVVVGVLSPVRRNENAQQSTPEQEEARILRYAELPNVFRTQRRLDHALLSDPAGQLMNEARGQQQNQNQQRSSRFAPRAAVLSTDNVVRWEGWIDSPGFRAAIDRVLAVDPGVAARRAAEAEFLRRGGQPLPAAPETPAPDAPAPDDAPASNAPSSSGPSQVAPG
jgi:hypothetical protein